MSIDDVKKFWNDRPCNIRHSNKSLSTKEFFIDVSTKKYFAEPHILNFINHFDYKDKKVLEIGCGIGTAAQSFVEKGAIYTGIDISDKSIEIAKQRFELFNLNGTFMQGNAENMNMFHDNSFDLVYSFGVIHHTENPEKIIDEIYRLVKPGGEIKIMLYAKDSWKKMMIDRNLDQYEAQAGCPIAYTYSRNEIFELFKKFSNIHIYQDHIFPYKVEEYKNNIYVFQDYFEHMPKNIFSELQKILGWHLCITCTKEENILNDNISISSYNFPWPHTIIDNMFRNDIIINAANSICDYDDIDIENYKEYKNEYANKKEISNISFFPEQVKNIIRYLRTPEFIHKLENITGIYNLIIDEQIYGGGISISPNGAKLEKHIDFNINSDINMYRAVNLILYFNDNWTEENGGCFQLFDEKSNEIKKICPSINKAIIFSSNNKTMHGFNEIKHAKSRKSLNLLYYTERKPDYVDKYPHNRH